MQRCKAMIMKTEWFGMMIPKVGNGPIPKQVVGSSYDAVQVAEETTMYKQ